MKRQKRKTRCEILLGGGQVNVDQAWVRVDRAVRTGNGNELHYEWRAYGQVETGVTRHWRLVPVEKAGRL